MIEAFRNLLGMLFCFIIQPVGGFGSLELKPPSVNQSKTHRFMALLPNCGSYSHKKIPLTNTHFIAKSCFFYFAL